MTPIDANQGLTIRGHQRDPRASCWRSLPVSCPLPLHCARLICGFLNYLDIVVRQRLAVAGKPVNVVVALPLVVLVVTLWFDLRFLLTTTTRLRAVALPSLREKAQARRPQPLIDCVSADPSSTRSAPGHGAASWHDPEVLRTAT